MKRFSCALLAVLLLFSVNMTVFAAQTDDMLADCRSRILRADKLLPGDEWAVIALALSGGGTDDEAFDEYLSALCEYLHENSGVLSRSKYTEYARTALALAALGQNPRNFENFDILSPLYDYDAVVKQGINGPVWALLALDYNGVPDKYSAEMVIREKYIDYILSRALPSGGFALSGESYDIDVTAMAALALFRYGGEAESAAQKAAQMLANARKDGYYLSLGKPACESAAQALIALCALDAPRENIEQALETLERFYIKGEGFCHEPGGKADTIASIQAALALAAFERYAEGGAFIYDMSVPVSFFDISEISQGGEAVYALAGRGIITGFADGSFNPQGTLTRAQLATIFTRALGLEGEGQRFSDVADTAWYARYVSAATANGLILGRGNGIFDPESPVTRQEGRIMLGRAYALFGLQAPFGLPQDSTALTRLECAQFIYDLLLDAGEIVK